MQEPLHLQNPKWPGMKATSLVELFYRDSSAPKNAYSIIIYSPSCSLTDLLLNTKEDILNYINFNQLAIDFYSIYLFIFQIFIQPYWKKRKRKIETITEIILVSTTPLQTLQTINF